MCREGGCAASQSAAAMPLSVGRGAMAARLQHAVEPWASKLFAVEIVCICPQRASRKRSGDRGALSA
eukprot:11155099-Lingulodinium_polyedra.AAC.1